MINFLKAEAKTVLSLQLVLSYQVDNSTVKDNTFTLNTEDIYAFTVATSSGLETIVGKMDSYTLSPKREVMAFVNQDTLPSMVDTLTIDCSSNGESKKRTINVFDIRNLVVISGSTCVETKIPANIEVFE